MAGMPWLGEGLTTYTVDEGIGENRVGGEEVVRVGVRSCVEARNLFGCEVSWKVLRYPRISVMRWYL